MFHARITKVGAAGQLVPLAELLGAFSYALDITQGQPSGHCVRACWIGSHIGRAIGLIGDALWELYYSVLLKDLGCSSNAARICALYLTDDRAFKHDFKQVGASLASTLGFVLRSTGAGQPLARRAGALAHILGNAADISRGLIETRCTRGADIARRLRFSEGVADGIYALDEHWDGSGMPLGLAGDAIPLAARIALLAQVADVFHSAGGRDAALAEVRRRAGTWFDPALVRAFEAVARDDAFWHDLASPFIDAKLFMLEPATALVLVDDAYLDDIAAAFGDVVDAKSPFTSGHSSRVADLVTGTSAALGQDPARTRWLRRGALLHDIGKLGVSNTILDKPGKLDADEWTVMRAHPAHTREILGRISAFDELAPMAAAHHERLDGRGYPHGLAGDAIRLETRIITVCDIFDALTADRPYRASMDTDEAMAIIAGDIGTVVDPDCFDALRAVVREERGG